MDGEPSQNDIFGCTDANTNTENTINTDKIGKNSFWSLVTSVFRLASFGAVKATPKGSLKHHKMHVIL